MDATLAADAASISQTATRLQRIGLIVDRRALSPPTAAPPSRCSASSARGPNKDEPKHVPIGFAYPNAR